MAALAWFIIIALLPALVEVVHGNSEQQSAESTLPDPMNGNLEASTGVVAAVATSESEYLNSTSISTAATPTTDNSTSSDDIKPTSTQAAAPTPEASSRSSDISATTTQATPTPESSTTSNETAADLNNTSGAPELVTITSNEILDNLTESSTATPENVTTTPRISPNASAANPTPNVLPPFALIFEVVGGRIDGEVQDAVGKAKDFFRSSAASYIVCTYLLVQLVAFAIIA